METIFSWIDSNKEWFFSGIGVAIITTIISLFFMRTRSKKQTQKSGDNSVNIQVGGNINIHTKETDDE
jgi:high-affinity Fe2+/Pb2+ permease